MPGVLLAVVLGLRLLDPAPLQAFRLKLFDFYSQIAPRPHTPAPVAVVEIDEESLRRFGQWPWPRTLVADLLRRLFEGGARVVAFNIVFAEPDRTAPRQVLPQWFGQPALDPSRLRPEERHLAAAILASVPDHDRVLADTIEHARPREGAGGVVAGAVLLPEGADCRSAPASSTSTHSSGPDLPGSALRRPESSTGECLPAAKASYAQAGDDPLPFLPSYRGATINLPAIERGADGIGSFNLTAEPDGIVRRVPILMRVGDRVFPSLGPEAVRVFLGASTYVIRSSGASMERSFGERAGLDSIKIGHRIVPVDAAGRLWLHFAQDRPERGIPAWQILAEEFDAGTITGRIVFVGTSAPGLASLRVIPLGREVAGTHIHAEVAEQILVGDFVRTASWHTGLDFLLIVLVGGALILAGPRFGALSGAMAVLAVLAALSGTSWYLYAERQFFFDPVYGGIAALAVFMGTSVLSWLRSEGERAWVRKAFDQYLSPALVEQLAREPDRLRLGGDLRVMTFLFCDVRDFTGISETYKNDPRGLIRLVNRFLGALTDVVLSRNGTIDKYMGDCIMAYWNAPLDDSEHARHACEAALAMSGALDRLNAELAAEAAAGGPAPVRIRAGIGINTGECVVGNMGSNQRFDYSVLGDAVNLASRLEGLSRQYGVDIVIGEETHAAVEDSHATLELDLVAVKGKQEAVRVFALMGGEEMRADDGFRTMHARTREMLEAYRAREWGRATELLNALRRIGGGPRELHDLYETRIHHFLCTPPPSDWDGVFVARTK